MALPRTLQNSHAHPGHRRSGKAPQYKAGRGCAQLPPTAGTTTPGHPPRLVSPAPRCPRGSSAEPHWWHCPGRAQPLSQPCNVETGTHTSSPAPAQEHLLLQLFAAKHHALASNQPELALYKPLIGLKQEVLIPNTLPLLYKGYSSAPTGSMPFPSKLKLAADSKLCCTASRVPMLSPPAPVGQSKETGCPLQHGRRSLWLLQRRLLAHSISGLLSSLQKH